MPFHDNRGFSGELIVPGPLTGFGKAEPPVKFQRAEVGFAHGSETSVLRLARLAQDAGLDGVVASPREIHAIREACGSEFVILTPGIRSAGDATGDQKRTMSATEAVEAGATYVVVGRPITEAPDPRAAAAAIWG